MITVARDQVAAYRLTAQHLSDPLPLAATEHATACGLQDTPPGNAALMMAARSHELTAEVLAASMASGSLVQVVCMRQAPHLVRAADLALFTTALLPGGAVAAVEVDGARRRLLRRYLRWFGPSTAADFGGWAGIAPHAAEAIWEGADLPTERVGVDGREAWMHRDDVSALQAATAPVGVVLVPAYDPYLQARDRTVAVPDVTAHERVFQASTSPGVVLADGEVIALWRPHQVGGRLTITVEPILKLSADDLVAIQSTAARYAPLLGCTSAEVARTG